VVRGGWRRALFGLVANVVGRINEDNQRPARVSTWVGDPRQTDEPSPYVTSHPGQLAQPGHPSVG